MNPWNFVYNKHGYACTAKAVTDEDQVFIGAQADYWREPIANTPTPEYIENAKQCMQCQFFRMFLF